MDAHLTAPYIIRRLNGGKYGNGRLAVTVAAAEGGRAQHRRLSLHRPPPPPHFPPALPAAHRIDLFTYIHPVWRWPGCRLWAGAAAAGAARAAVTWRQSRVACRPRPLSMSSTATAAHLARSLVAAGRRRRSLAKDVARCRQGGASGDTGGAAPPRRAAAAVRPRQMRRGTAA